MLRGLLTVLTFVVTTTVLGIVAIVAGLVMRVLTGNRKIVLQVGKLWARLHLAAMGIKPVYEGLEHARGDAPRIFLANHLSTLDIWVLVPALPDSTKFVAKKSIFWIPVLGQAMSIAGFIPIDRGDRARAMRSLADAARRVAAGASVILFPEGTRSRDGKLARFKRGSFHLASQAGVPVVPISISGTGKIVRPGSIVVQRGTVRVTFSPPVDPKAFVDDLDVLSDRVREAIAANLSADEL
jgi:1-acyl-sn-glycerol-3-phosphate acyltransferase